MSAKYLNLFIEIILALETAKQNIFKELESFIEASGLTLVSKDIDRPWGGFFVIDEKDSEAFIHKFFPELLLNEEVIGSKVSPKILVVAPKTRLSWQYHNFRSEIWKLVDGKAKIMLSASDHQPPAQDMVTGQVVVINQGERHRLIGDSDSWGIIAEIWKHDDRDNPSTENDIVRIADDYGRNT